MTSIPEDVMKLAAGTAARVFANAVDDDCTLDAATATDIIARAILTDREARSGIPAGYKLVPVEPTEEMLDAYWRQTGESKEMRSRTHAYMRRYYSAMLDVVPAYPSPSREETEGELPDYLPDDIESYFNRQIWWSRETFGPALRTNSVIDHIRKELKEIEQSPHDLSEWIDVVILAMDGFWRHGGKASDLLPSLLAKQRKNMARTWPDWRTMPEDRTIEHDRSSEAPKPDASALLLEAEKAQWPIDTDDQIEALARECEWDNRKYMTPADYSIWCERMRKFARLSKIRGEE